MENLNKKFNRWLAKRRLASRYLYLNEVNKLLEEYLTQRIIAGGSSEFINKSRTDLTAKQHEIKETEKMVAFFKNVK